MDRSVECWTSGMERRQSLLDPKSLDSSDERERDHKRGELVAFGGSTNLRSHGDADRSYRVWKTRADLHDPEWAVVAWRNGPGYVLINTFHLAPWLALVANRQQRRLMSPVG